MRASAKCLWTLCLLALTSTLGAQDFGLDIDDFPVIPAQLTESIPSPLDEAAPLGASRPSSESTGIMDFPATAPNGDLSFTSQPATHPADQLPSSGGELIYDTGAGQAYDIHMGDLIGEPGAEVHSTSNWFRGGQWYSQQEIVLLLRTSLPKVHVAIDQTRANAGLNGAVFIDGSLNTKQMDFTFQPGTRLTLGRTLGRDLANRDHAVELTFFGLFNYEGQAAIRKSDPAATLGGGAITLGIETLLGTNEAFFDRANVFGFLGINTVPGFSRADAQSMKYDADLNSFELNYRIGARPSRDRLIMQPDGRWVRHATPSNISALFLGVRYMSQNELFEYTSVGGQLPGERGLYRVATNNDMIGVQLGGEITEKRTDWVFGLRSKLGGLYNFAQRDSFVDAVGDVDFNGTVEGYTRSQALSAQYLAFVGEAGIYFAYFLRPNTSLRMGYDAMLLNGLATATNNIGLMPEFPKFEVTNISLYHGMNFGFEMTW